MSGSPFEQPALESSEKGLCRDPVIPAAPADPPPMTPDPDALVAEIEQTLGHVRRCLPFQALFALSTLSDLLRLAQGERDALVRARDERIDKLHDRAEQAERERDEWKKRSGLNKQRATANMFRADENEHRAEQAERERDEWKQEAELRGLPKELMQRLHRSEARVKVLETALEIIRDTRSDGGRKLISGREAQAIADAALGDGTPISVSASPFARPALESHEKSLWPDREIPSAPRGTEEEAHP